MNYNNILAGLTNLLTDCEVLKASMISPLWSGVAVKKGTKIVVAYTADHSELKSKNQEMLVDIYDSPENQDSDLTTDVYPNVLQAMSAILYEFSK